MMKNSMNIEDNEHTLIKSLELQILSIDETILTLKKTREVLNIKYIKECLKEPINNR